MTDQEFEDLKATLRQQRLLGEAGHWSYELGYHSYLFRKYNREKQRRDNIAINAAMDRYHRIVEAAE
jgi:hypothetical protein